MRQLDTQAQPWRGNGFAWQRASKSWRVKSWKSQMVVVARAFNPSTRDTEASGSLWVGGQPGLQSEFQASQGYITRLPPTPSPAYKGKKIFFIFVLALCVCACVRACSYTPSASTCMHVAIKTRTECPFPRCWCYRHLWATQHGY